MASGGQRAFAQKLSRQHAAEVRKQVSSAYVKDIPTSGSGGSLSATISLSDGLEPVDYENFAIQHQNVIEKDPMRHLLEFPPDDIEVGVIPRKIRTVHPVIPEEGADSEPHVRDCVHCYTADWVGVCRRYQCYSSSYNIRDKVAERINVVRATPKQTFEIDLEDEAQNDGMDSQRSSVVETPRASVVEVSPRSSRSSSGDVTPRNSTASAGCETPRGSWASSVFDLRNSRADPLLPGLLDKVPVEYVDRFNESRRQQDRQEALFSLYPLQEEEEIVERRLPADIPAEHSGHRILVKCSALKLELEVEPHFGIMALYDAKEKKKISENFYFDLNPEPIKKMLAAHVPHQDFSTLSRSCIFNITYPSPDIFLVVKLEKILQQGDISESAEPYMKDDKRDKVRANAQYYCERLGQYCMPFAWTAIYLTNIVKGVASLERDSDSDAGSIASSSLERKSVPNFDSFKQGKSGSTASLPRRGSLERLRSSGSEKRRSWSPEEASANLECFRPVTLTVSSFFKQESEKLSDEDLYKFLVDLKRPTSGLKKLKCIPGTLKLDISPCPEEVKYCLTPELARLDPYPDDKGRPTKEILEFPSKEVFVPHYVYRNLLYVYPKNLNFASRAGSARNIAVKVQFIAGEGDHNALPVIFGKSSCPDYRNHAYAAVTYHNKYPDFYEEVKVRMPAVLDIQHHLLFTFFHISCQKKVEQTPIETPIGYTWLPIYRERRLQVGEFCLPVSVERPPPGYSMHTTDVMLPGMKWLDNHKGVFTVKIEAFSSIHTLDPLIDRFLAVCYAVEDPAAASSCLRGGGGGGGGGGGEAVVEGELKASITDLSRASVEALVRFLTLVMDKLLLLLVRPPVVAGQMINIGQTSFEALAQIVRALTSELEFHNDHNGRSGILATYIQFSCTLPHPDASLAGSMACSPTGNYGMVGRSNTLPIHGGSSHQRSTSNPDLTGRIHPVEIEAAPVAGRGMERTGSMRTTYENIYSTVKPHYRKLVHEEIALQWVVSSGSVRETALTNAWFCFELMVKSMAQHLAETDKLDAPRRMRFSDQYVDDITALLVSITGDIGQRYNKDSRLIVSLNTSTAFFIYDILSLMDRGYVFGLVRTYCREITKRISMVTDSAGLMNLKLDFLRIVCSHEHYITLNLPFGTPLTQSVPSSPNPSIASSQSGSALSTLSAQRDSGNFAELTLDYKQQHYLVGLVLSDLSSALDGMNSSVHNRAINLVRNLLTCHDSDPRYSEPECKNRVAALYLPLLSIVMDSLCQLHDASLSAKGLQAPPADGADHLPGSQTHPINQNVAMAIAGSWSYQRSSDDSLDPFQQKRKALLSVDATRNLLACFLWLLNNVARHMLDQWWAELSQLRMQQLLDVLFFCISIFEYKGRAVVRKQSQQVLRKTTDIKSKLEDAILGTGSARSEMMMRRRGNTAQLLAAAERNPPSPHMSGERSLRWRKDMTHWKQAIEQQERPRAEIDNDAHIEGNLSTEVSLLILDMLEFIVQQTEKSDTLQGSSLLGGVLRVLQHMLACSQSELVLQNIFASQRSLVFKFPELLFDEETEQCADLCLRLLTHCSSSLSSIRSQASASLYLLMRQNFEIGNNFARVKMQVTMSLSSLVGTNQKFNEEYLRRSLKTILLYAEEDTDLQETTFPEQVKDLVFNLHMILSDTVKMKEFQEDPEMLIDLMYRIAKGYQASPDLRLTWLQNMAGKHSERNNHAEAALCLVHSAALVAEYLHMIEDRTYLPIGCVTFQKISPNVLEESAVSDDVVSPDEEGICTGKYFSESGLVGLLEQAASSFSIASMYEAVNDVYRILIPIHEANKDYKKLASLHGKLNEAFTKIVHQGKRMFSCFYRVGFYGNKFGDLDGEEFIYKEQPFVKLPEITHRLESFYIERYGQASIHTIKDSNNVDRTKLNPDIAYIQITYVEPYFDLHEFRDRTTDFEKNYNIRRFVYATPFTPDGRAHGQLGEQYKRKTILTTTQSLPYVRTRIQVQERKQIVLTPIEVAIEDIQKKTVELGDALMQDPPDPKILQMVIQGCIGTTVNQGPMEVALVFLADIADGSKPATKHHNKLRLCFKEFIRRCGDALRRNKSLIGPEQREYQKELERNYKSLCDKLWPMLANTARNTIKIKDQYNNDNSYSKVTVA